MRIGYGLMAVVFFGFAAVQWNDPDPVQWIAIYGGAGVAAASAALGRVRRLPALAVGIVALCWGVTLLPEALQLRRLGDVAEGMNIMRPEIEVARELGGLSIVALAMAVLAVHASRAAARDIRPR